MKILKVSPIESKGKYRVLTNEGEFIGDTRSMYFDKWRGKAFKLTGGGKSFWSHSFYDWLKKCTSMTSALNAEQLDLPEKGISVQDAETTKSKGLLRLVLSYR